MHTTDIMTHPTAQNLWPALQRTTWH